MTYFWFKNNFVLKQLLNINSLLFNLQYTILKSVLLIFREQITIRIFFIKFILERFNLNLFILFIT